MGAELRVPVGTLTPHRAGSAWEYGRTLKSSSISVRAPADSARPASLRRRGGGLLTHCFLVSHSQVQDEVGVRENTEEGGLGTVYLSRS